MRIAYVNQTYPPMITGVSHMLYQLAEGMRRRGHSILVIVASDVGEPYTISKPGLKIVRLRSHRNPMAAQQRVMVWPKPQIKALLQEFSPHLVHFHDPILASTARPGRLQGFKIPMILTAHVHPGVLGSYTSISSVFKSLLLRGTCTAANQIFRHYDAVVAPSRTIARFVTGMGDRPVSVISNGIDLLRFNPQTVSGKETYRLRRKLRLHPDLPVILTVGRLSKEKNLPAVLRAAAGVMRAMDAQLVVAGSGPEGEKLAGLCKDLDISDRTFFPGFVYPDGDLPGLYRLASVFVAASEVEAQGLVLLEAAASGTPVVTVRSGAAPEIVKDGVNGRLVLPGDEVGMAERVIEILQDPDMARNMGVEGRLIAETHALDETFQAHESLYRSLISPSLAEFNEKTWAFPLRRTSLTADQER